MERTFGENVQFDVEDAVDKLVRLGIASEAGDGRLKHVALGQAVKAIGTTTDEIFGSTDLIDLIDLIDLRERRTAVQIQFRLALGPTG